MRGEGLIERRDLAHQDAHRPAIPRDVMQGEEDGVLPLREAQEQTAQQRTAREVEGQDRRFVGQGESPRLARVFRQTGEIDERKREGLGRSDLLHRRARPRGEDRAQRFVPADDLAESARQHGGVERPSGAERRRDVVARAPRFELVDEPEPLLGE